MSAKSKPGLGRGFDSLIPTHLVEEKFDPTAKTDKKVSSAHEVAVSEIKPSTDQPRKAFADSALNDLANSIKVHGIIQPLVVVESDGGYTIIAGERRWRAAKLAGLEKVPVIVRTLTDQAALELALIENLQREDLNPLEVATAMLKLSEQFNLSRDQVAKQVGKSAPTVSNTIRLLGLPDDAKNALAMNKISEGHARAILALKNDEDKVDLLKSILMSGWSVRRAEQYVTESKQGNKPDKVAGRGAIHQTEDTKILEKLLVTEVRDRPMAKGAGRILVSYKSEADRARIIDKLIGS